MRPKLFVSRPLGIDVAAMLGERAEVTVSPVDRPLSQPELIEAAAEADGLVAMLHDPCDEVLLDALPKLRVIANAAVGTNNIDIEACRARGVRVCNTPGVLTEASADLTWTLILACTRRVREGERLMRSGGFDGWGPTLLLGFGLQGKTIGIYGMGRIGQAVARRARAFGMRVIYHNRRPVDAAIEAELDARLVSKDELIAQSDLLSLHAPLTAETIGAFGAEELAAMKPGSVLINTARGPMLDEDALVRALGRGQLRAAGLDVYEQEPIVHPGLIDRDDVVLLPHLGSATTETRAVMARMAVDSAMAVLEGREPPNAAD